MTISRLIQSAALILLGQSVLSAHDFWIEPSAFRPANGTGVAIQLKLGHIQQAEAFRRNSAHIKRFFVAAPTGEGEIGGIDGMNPAGYLAIESAGLHIIGYQSQPSMVELPAESFESYLVEEGLERIVQLRAERGETDRKGREVYSRSAKSLVYSGTAVESRGDRQIGLSLELVAEANPYLLSPGDELPLRIIFRGEPLGGALVTAVLKGQNLRVSDRSDARGRVRLRLPKTGVWLVKTVYMVPAQDREQSDWESFWASLTFELGR